MGRKAKRAQARREAPAPWMAEAPWNATINYRETPFGTWTVTLSIGELDPVRYSAPDAHEALHLAMDHLDVLLDEDPGCPGVASVSMLDGDPSAWVRLAAQEGFLGCAQTASSQSGLAFM